MKAIEVENLTFSYDGDHPALNGVSFSLEEGSLLSIIGHNGSGKSTLAKILMGLLGNYKGSVKIFDLDLNSKNIYKIRSRLGIVFQNPDNQFVGSTVSDDIAFGLENKKVPHDKMVDLVNEFAKKTGMDEYLDKEPQNLSGGQKQRVAIAGVLAMAPDLVIFDEATAMLDPKGKKEIYELLAKMRLENPKLTVLSITHDIEMAASSDQIIVLNDGKLLYSGTPQEVFSKRDELAKMRLDVPFVYALKDELKKKGVVVPDDIKDLDSLEAFLCQ